MFLCTSLYPLMCEVAHPEPFPFSQIIFIALRTSSQDRFGVLFLFSSPINGTTNPWTTRGFFPSLPFLSLHFLSSSTPTPEKTGSTSYPTDLLLVFGIQNQLMWFSLSSFFFSCEMPANRCGIRVYRCFAGWSDERHGNTTDHFLGRLRSVNGESVAPIFLPARSHIFQSFSSVFFDFSFPFHWLFRGNSVHLLFCNLSIFSRRVKREKTVKNWFFLLEHVRGKWKIMENGRMCQFE